MSKFLLRLISTFFYVGYFPLIPGTAGSLAGVFIFLLVKNNTFAHILTLGGLLALGFFVGGRAERLMQKKDPSCIVIDEVCGMLLSLLFLPYDIKFIVVAFVIFRILDTLKPYPVGRLERLKGSLGIMSDDIVAGLYTNIVLQVVVISRVLSAS
ncbi:MAG: phosphatidylglycerophosphatase A [Candidatus Omnitrophica bacterium]|nr:phosphatidylglycerophosphatase A [Candidatus Omnitrophota bacterium]